MEAAGAVLRVDLIGAEVVDTPGIGEVTLLAAGGSTVSPAPPDIRGGGENCGDVRTLRKFRVASSSNAAPPLPPKLFGPLGPLRGPTGALGEGGPP